jgi:tetratricopeptide (TPR) repeat protein
MNPGTVSKKIRMKRLIFILLVTASGITLEAQTNLDSLLAIWNDPEQSDSLRVRAYRNYIWNGFVYSQPDSAFRMAEELLAFGINKNYLKAQSLAYETQGVSWYVKSDYPKALDYFTRKLEIDKQISYQKGIAATLNNIGLIYSKQGAYLKALDNYTKSLQIEEQIGNQSGIALSLNNIGIIYNNLGDFENAFNYYNKSLMIKEQIGDLKGAAASLNNIGIIFQDQGDFPKALEYHFKSLKIKQEIGDRFGIAPSLTNIGTVYLNLGDFDKALDYHTQSLKIKEEIGDQIGITQSLNYIGIVYHKLGNYPNALEYCHRSYELALTLGALEYQRNSCSCLYDTYKAMGNGIKALEYHELLIVIKDSLDAEETAKRLQQMEFQKAMLQDSIKKADEARIIQEAHKKEVRRKNRSKNVFLASGVIMVFVVLGLWRGLHFVRRSRKEIASEKEKSDTLLLNILPKEIADELKQTGEAKPRKYEQVSILFTDFVDFTRISEKMTPDELVTEINACYKTFDRIIEKRGIEKIKTIGDAYMAADGFIKEKSLSAQSVALSSCLALIIPP